MHFIDEQLTIRKLSIPLDLRFMLLYTTTHYFTSPPHPHPPPALSILTNGFFGLPWWVRSESLQPNLCDNPYSSVATKGERPFHILTSCYFSIFIFWIPQTKICTFIYNFSFLSCTLSVLFLPSSQTPAFLQFKFHLH